METPLVQPELKTHKFNHKTFLLIILLIIFLVFSSVVVYVFFAKNTFVPFNKAIREESKTAYVIDSRFEGWNLYKSKEFSYEISYPKDWSWREMLPDANGTSRTVFGYNVDKLEVRRPDAFDSTADFVTILRIPTELSVPDWVKNATYFKTAGKNITVGGKQALQYSEAIKPPQITNFDYSTVVVKGNGNNLFVITFKTQDTEVKKERNLMLTSLKFTPIQAKETEKVGTSSWKNYQSSQYGYSLKLPSDWRKTQETSEGMFFRSYSKQERGQGTVDEFGELETELTISSKSIQTASKEELKIWGQLKKITSGESINFNGTPIKKVKSLKLDSCDAMAIYIEQEIKVNYGIICLGQRQSVGMVFVTQTIQIYELNQAIFDTIAGTFKFNQFKP